jgi:rubrerythrin
VNGDLMTDLTLADLDVDGALEEAVGNLHGTTRAGLFRGALIGSAALLGIAAAPASAEEEEEEDERDVEILNFALALEDLQAAFYTEVERNKVLKGALKTQAHIVGEHERAHVVALRKVLGEHAAKLPRYDFKGATEDAKRFRRTAVAFEDLSVAAYKAQAPHIKEREYLVPALAILSVEARHAAWIRRLAGILPAADAFDEPRSKASTLKIVDRTQFVVQTQSRDKPKMTG